MPRLIRTGALLAGAAFAAGWAYRTLVPKGGVSQVRQRKVAAHGRRLKRCRDCDWKFFIDLPEAKRPGN